MWYKFTCFLRVMVLREALRMHFTSYTKTAFKVYRCFDLKRSTPFQPNAGADGIVSSKLPYNT